MAGNLTIKSIVTDNRVIARFSDKFLPKVARHGELYVVDGILYLYATLADGEERGRWFPLTDEKEVYTFEQPTDLLEWVIPVEFHTNDLQIIVYDNFGKVFGQSFGVDVSLNSVKITFDSPLSGQAYLFVSKPKTGVFWTDAFDVGNKNLLMTKDETVPTDYYLEINTKYLEILKTGNVTFKKGLTVGGTITVINDLIAELNSHIKGHLYVGGNTVIDGNLTVKGTTTSIQTKEIKLDDNIVTLNSNAVGTPVLNAGIEVFRGDEGTTTIIQWDELKDETNIPNNVRITKSLQVDGNTNIDGDLTIKGKNVNIQTTTLNVSDNIITINKGFSGILTDNVGLEIDTGASVMPLIIFDSSKNYVTVPVKQQDGTFIQDEISGKTFTLTEIDIERNRAVNQENVIVNRVSQLEITVENNNTDLLTRVNTEKTRIDAILSAASADKDSFVEIVNLISSVDTENDSIFAGYVISNNSAVHTVNTELAQEIVNRKNAVNDEINVRKTAVETLNTNINNTINLEKNYLDHVVSTSHKIDTSVLHVNSMLGCDISYLNNLVTTFFNDTNNHDKVCNVEFNPVYFGGLDVFKGRKVLDFLNFREVRFTAANGISLNLSATVSDKIYFSLHITEWDDITTFENSTLVIQYTYTENGGNVRTLFGG
jgi:hypothetical protein